MDFRAISGGGLTHVVSTAGDGPDVVLLHGFPDTPHSWAPLEQELVGAGHRVSVPWLRGYHPENIVAGRGYDPETIGRDALALLDAIGAERAVLVGHDWGALASYAAATLEPERVRGIVTVAIPHPSVLTRSPRAFWAVRHFFALKLPWAERSCRRGDFAYIARLYRRWAPGWSGPDREESLRQAKQAFAAEGTLAGALGYYRDLPVGGTALFEQAPTVPGLIVGGTDDIAAAELFTRTAELFPAGSRALIVEGAGHWPHPEQPATVTPELLEFVAQLDA